MTATGAQQGYKYLYKILPGEPPYPLRHRWALTDQDKKDGFIHLLTADFLPYTAARYHQTKTTLWVYQIAITIFGSERFEPNATGGIKYIVPGRVVWEDMQGQGPPVPHLYHGDLGQDEVAQVLTFERADGQNWDAVITGLAR